MKIDALRKVARWKVRLIITQRHRNKAGFTVTGPDGKTYQAVTRAEALANLKVRMQCHEVAPWRIEATPTVIKCPQCFKPMETDRDKMAGDWYAQCRNRDCEFDGLHDTSLSKLARALKK